MPTIRLSSNITNSVMAGQLGSLIATTASSQNLPYGIFGQRDTNDFGTISRLNIYKGTVPSFSTFTDLTQRSSDLLISFLLLNAGSSQTSLGIVDNKTRWLVGKCLTTTTATASGTAAWFLAYSSYPAGTALSSRGAMTGTVGASGSGSDLEIANTNIVSGGNYQSAGFFINLPQSRVW